MKILQEDYNYLNKKAYYHIKLPKIMNICSLKYIHDIMEILFSKYKTRFILDIFDDVAG